MWDSNAVFYWETGWEIFFTILQRLGKSFIDDSFFFFATLTNPVVFNEMGGEDDDTIDVSVIVMLAVKDGPKHLEVLQKLIESIQKDRIIVFATHFIKNNRIC
jgi:hypothetical protein